MNATKRTLPIAVSRVCLLALLIAGCRSSGRFKLDQPLEPTPNESAQAPVISDPARAGKTDFESKVTRTQAYGTHLALGKNFARDGNYGMAVVEFEKAVEAAERMRGLRTTRNARAEAHRQLAKSLDHLGNFPKAHEHYKQAEKATPNDPRVWNDWGYSYYMQGMFADAEQCLRRALKLEPDSPGVLTNLGLTLAAAGRSDEALAMLSKMGGPAVGHANLGYMLASLGRTDEARTHYLKALELKPGTAVVKTALAQLDLPPLPTELNQAVASATPRPQRPGVDPGLVRTSFSRTTAHPALSSRSAPPTTRPLPAVVTMPPAP
jgi:Flp pilus assembly protein TadD